ncbi:MAG TPA: O-antigen ligase family protein [Marmoricola sp.]|jgi:O-antigen ligase|nr:O-antigen ligase family protein [Marmoricola sp.]
MSVTTRAAIWLICLSPLAWIPDALDRFVFPKLALAAAAIACGALAQRQGKVPKDILIVSAVGVGWFTLACLLSPTPVASLLGRWPRYEGVPVILTYAGCAWLGARLLGNRTKAAMNELFTAVSVVSLVLAALSILTVAGWSIEGASTESRTGSVLGNATDQGLVGMMLFAVLLAAALDRRTPLLIAGAVAGPVTVLLSGSRASLLAVVVVLAVQTYFRRKELVRVAAGAIVALAALSLLLPQVRDRLGDRKTVTGRLLLWQQAGHVGLDRWWSGGPSTFIDAVGKYRNENWVRDVGTQNPPDSPHSWVLQALVAGGIPLLLIALALAALLVRTGYRAVLSEQDPLTIGAFSAMAGYGLALLPNFTIAGSTCLAAFLVGCLVASEAGRKEQVVWIRAISAVAALGVIAFTCGAFAERSLETGIVASRHGEISQAHKAFETAESLRPFDGDIAMLASQALAGAANSRVPGAAAETELWARRSLARTPDTYASGLALAVAEVSTGDLADAHTELDRLITLYPTEPNARIQRGIVRFGQGDLAGARADLRLAQHLAPHDPAATTILRKINADARR